MANGYWGKILEVDVTAGKSSAKEVSDGDYRKYLGGASLGARVLWERLTKPHVDPFGLENVFMLLVGPCTGMPLPGFSRFCTFSKSPLTSLVGEKAKKYPSASTISWSTGGGQFAPELRFAGYDGIIITGQSPRPVYIYIEDDKVEIRDAAHLWGKGTNETDILLRQELGPAVRTVYIGPAAENLVPYCGVITESSRAAGRGGTGSVLGSKKVKAIAVRGTKVPPVDDVDALMRLRDEMFTAVFKNPGMVRRQLWGTSVTVLANNDQGLAATRNHREGSGPDEYYNELGGVIAQRKFWVKHRACYQCPVRCMKVGIVPSGKYAGIVSEGPEYETQVMLGSDLGCTDLYALQAAIAVCDDLGLDPINTGGILAFAMECYEKGIFTKTDLDGIELNWGNMDGAIELMKKIAKREGIGALLAKGTKKIAEELGRDTMNFAMQAKGQEMAAWTIPGDPARAIGYGTSPRGACHVYGDRPEAQFTRVLQNSLVQCIFCAVDEDLTVKGLSTITKWNISKEEYKKIGERAINLMRAFNVREGFDVEDDVIPERVHSEPFTVGPKKGASVPKDTFKQMLGDYYKAMGWDERGIPTKEKLSELGLEDVAAQL